MKPSALTFLVLTFFVSPDLYAQSQDCEIGTKVQLKDGQAGTLAEVGTERPHVGWYRIVFSWSPGGEWYDPKTWVTYIAGRETRCCQAQTRLHRRHRRRRRDLRRR